MTLDAKRQKIGKWLEGPDGGALWDIMCALRGPDSPSETPSMSPQQRALAYNARRKRKFNTVEVIREKAFFGVVGGCARHHEGDTILLPPTIGWDHFDGHMQKAANVLGLKVVIETPTNKSKNMIPVQIETEPKPELEPEHEIPF